LKIGDQTFQKEISRVEAIQDGSEQVFNIELRLSPGKKARDGLRAKVVTVNNRSLEKVKN
jgi:hypothetical protein